MCQVDTNLAYFTSSANLHSSPQGPWEYATMVQSENSRDQQIRSWVDHTLSTENDLVPGAFPLTEQIINKQGSLCGKLYCLHGPRSVRLVAVHDYASNRVLTYDSQGVRTGDWAVTELIDSERLAITLS